MFGSNDLIDMKPFKYETVLIFVNCFFQDRSKNTEKIKKSWL